MTTRQESEGDGKVARSYSLASAPLRLLSHSFHSTANTHSPPSSGSNSPVSHPGCDPTPPRHHEPSTSVSSASFDLKTETTIATNNFHNTLHASPTLPQPQPQPQHHVPQLDPRREAREARESKRQAQQLFDSDISSHEDICGRLSKAIKLEAAPWSPKQEMAESPDHTSPSLSLQSAEAQRLERLLLPYDIRYSIFGQLSLQDLYNLQLSCKLLYWATSDQSIWKRIALQLIQGEFYFDIPRTLPANIPNWKYFCKRHSLRQQNWRLGQVQDVITLDDNYQKLTTLQIMAPYVLTGCDDGRVHLWNINTRSLLHCFQVKGEITWVEHLQEEKIVAGLGYDIDEMRSEIRLFSTETGEQIGLYEENFWDLAICAINGKYLVASDGEGRYTAWDWRFGAKISQFKVEDETSITEALYLVQDTILELHYDGIIRLFSITGECFGRFNLDNILPNHQVSFCWLHNDLSMVVWESSNTMAHIRLPLLQNKNANGQPNTSLQRHITQEEWDAQGAEVYWRHQLTHTCNFAAMGGGRFQMLYVQIFENLMDQVPIRVHSLRPSRPAISSSSTVSAASAGSASGRITGDEMVSPPVEEEGYGWQHGEYVTAHSSNPELEKIIQGLRPSRIDCDPEYIVVGLVQGGVRLLQFAPVDDELLDKEGEM
ncbi:hypothetical protein BG000_011083 [Podila horticola]|nr:hypothetical protein BG000_011083 [Podila horticola]